MDPPAHPLPVYPARRPLLKRLRRRDGVGRNRNADMYVSPIESRSQRANRASYLAWHHREVAT
ncbi:hypothetical protein PAHAL_5G127700 [Panicum hallii]|uniref:Uncharacterized protein n=1 Tax=Panicum hallii TaxID=206008 RepID=A0A2T8IJY0_9POAL|nr:hypothetical protein PAHAL_5G127700 [Panicum hallii]